MSDTTMASTIPQISIRRVEAISQSLGASPYLALHGELHRPDTCITQAEYAMLGEVLVTQTFFPLHGPIPL